MKTLTLKGKTMVSVCFGLCVLLLAAGLTAAADESLGSNEDIAKICVSNAAEGLSAIAADFGDNEEFIDLIRSFVGPIRFYPDESGYFYVYTYSCVNIAHPVQPELVGRDLYDYQDAKGAYVIRELAETARKGGGLVEYYWEKPGKKGQYKKVGYVEPIIGTDYFIGTGVYLPEKAADN